MSKLEDVLKQYWHYAGEWHDAECAFVCVDHGVCDCNTTANKKRLNQALTADREAVVKAERERISTEINTLPHFRMLTNCPPLVLEAEAVKGTVSNWSEYKPVYVPNVTKNV